MRALWVATATLTVLLTSAQAQNYPNKPVRVIVPWPAGGLVDVAARQLSNRMQTMMGQPFVVENKLGAGGNIGADQVAKGPADGSQILAITLAHAANVSLFPNASYSFVNDLRPVALLATAAIAAGSNTTTVDTTAPVVTISVYSKLFLHRSL